MLIRSCVPENSSGYRSLYQLLEINEKHQGFQGLQLHVLVLFKMHFLVYAASLCALFAGTSLAEPLALAERGSSSKFTCVPAKASSCVCNGVGSVRNPSLLLSTGDIALKSW